MILINSGKLIIPEKERFIGFAGDDLNSTKQFLIENKTDENCIYRLYLIFDDGSVNHFVLDSKVENSSTILTWNISEDHIFKSGIVKAQIKAIFSNGQTYHTTCDYFYAGNSAEFSDEFKSKENSEFLRYEKELNEIYKMINSSDPGSFVTNDRTIAGFDLSTDITVEQLQTALKAYPFKVFATELTTASVGKAGQFGGVLTYSTASKSYSVDLYLCCSVDRTNGVYKWALINGDTLSDTQISTALAEYLKEHPLEGMGADGKSAYQIALDNGFTGSETDWLLSLKGEDGYDGIDGMDGKDGVSPVIEVSTVTGGTRLIITSGENEGSQVVTILNGKNGADGRGIESTEINSSGELVFNYTDDTSDNLGVVVGDGANMPEYVVSEANEVVDKVLQVQSDRTFTFAAITDLHYDNGNYTDGIKHAFQAMNHISKAIKLDMVAVLGDYTDGYPSTDITDAMADFKTINTMFDSLSFIPNMRQMGNHDYYADNIPVTRRLIQSHSDNVVWGSKQGGYFYRDFDDYKLRVICLNTNENNPIDTSTNKPASIISMTTQQCQWFADTLDMSTKEDAKDWQILVLSHQPLDYFATGDVCLSYIADAYKEGTSWSGNGVSCDYTDKNDAVLIGNIHGHVHNFIADTMYRGNSNSSKKTSVYRLCTPNACFGRENQYSGVWNEAATYAKTQNSAQDTSFVVYCIDLDTYTINAICYGAGYDRTLVYNIPSISYTNQLPIAIDTDGSIYNGKGWADDTRLNSSGTITAATGASTTGFIPVTENSVVRLRNVGMATTDSTTDYVHIYDENFTLILGCKTNQLSTNDYWINTVVTDETTGYITSFKLDNVSDNTRYMRLSTRVKLDSTSIITVDEEIE